MTLKSNSKATFKKRKKSKNLCHCPWKKRFSKTMFSLELFSAHIIA